MFSVVSVFSDGTFKIMVVILVLFLVSMSHSEKRKGFESFPIFSYKLRNVEINCIFRCRAFCDKEPKC